MNINPCWFLTPLALIVWIPGVWAETAAITGIEVDSMAEGQVRIQLETPTGEFAEPSILQDGTVLQLDFENTQLQLDPGENTEWENVDPGIISITLTSATTNPDLDPGIVRLEIQGQSGLPIVDLVPTSTGIEIIVVSVEEAGQEAGFVLDEIEVTATRDRYRRSTAATATRTNALIRDLPLSVQVVPEQVIEDQGAIELQEVLRNVSGVSRDNSSGDTTDTFLIRGFPSGSILRDGFRDGVFAERSAVRETANLEQVEVLKGPASLLQGQLDPGGLINLVTKQPLSQPFYSIELQAGSFDRLRSQIDMSGPLNLEATLRYRLNAVFEDSKGFRDFTDIERQFIAPIVVWEISDRITLTVDAEYLHDRRPFDRGLIAIGTQVADIPFSRRLGEPFDESRISEYRVGYQLEYNLSQEWSLRHSFRFSSTDRFRFNTQGSDLNESTGVLNRGYFFSEPELTETFILRNEASGEFQTGTLEHSLLFGIEVARQARPIKTRLGSAPSINIFDPVYSTTGRPILNEENSIPTSDRITQAENIGIYFQDLVSLSEHVKLLMGGRFDSVLNQDHNGLAGETIQETFTEFSPQMGLVYQPNDFLSVYASYSESFVSSPFNITVDESLVDPELGEQYEVGVKADFLNGRLSATLTAYEITKQNVATDDPDNPGFVIAVGEQQSQGVELDLSGEVSPGWDVIASYSYIDARITEDNRIEVGNRLSNVPDHSGSFWTTYRFQPGSDLEGLGLGVGISVVGERQGDNDNTFTLDPYALLDAAIYYESDSTRASINFKNILDQRYIESGGTRSGINPGDPFTMLGSLSIEY